MVKIVNEINLVRIFPSFVAPINQIKSGIKSQKKVINFAYIKKTYRGVDNSRRVFLPEFDTLSIPREGSIMKDLSLDLALVSTTLATVSTSQQCIMASVEARLL